MTKSGKTKKRGYRGLGIRLVNMVPFAALTSESGAISAEYEPFLPYRDILRAYRPHNVLSQIEMVRLCTPAVLTFIHDRRYDWVNHYLEPEFFFIGSDRDQLRKVPYFQVDKVIEAFEREGWFKAGMDFIKCLESVLPRLCGGPVQVPRVSPWKTRRQLNLFLKNIEFLQLATVAELNNCTRALLADKEDMLADQIRALPKKTLELMALIFTWRAPDLRAGSEKMVASDDQAVERVDPVLDKHTSLDPIEPVIASPVAKPSIRLVARARRVMSGASLKRKLLAIALVAGLAATAMVGNRVGFANVIHIMEAAGTAEAISYIEAMGMLALGRDEPLMVQAAFVLYKDSQYHRAEQLALQLTRSSDEAWEARGYFLLGIICNKTGLPDQARDHLEMARLLYKAVGQQSGVYRSGVELANVYRMMGYAQEALWALEKLEPVGEHSSDFWRVRSLALFDLGRYQESIESSFQRLASTSLIVHADIYSHIGLCHTLSGDSELGRKYTAESEALLVDQPVPLTEFHNRLNRYALDLYDGLATEAMGDAICRWAQEHQEEQVLHLLNVVETAFR